MDVQFVASIAPIVRDVEAARSFYRDALGLSFEGEDGDYMSLMLPTQPPNSRLRAVGSSTMSAQSRGARSPRDC